MLHPVGQFRLGLGKQHDLPVDARRVAASVDLRHPPHADQRVGARAEHQLLQIADLFQVPRLRCREDTLPQTPYGLLRLPPIDRRPVRDLAVRSVHHNTARMMASTACTVDVMTSNLSFRSGIVVVASSQGHQTHVSTLSGQAPALSGQLCRTTSGGPVITPRFPVAFRLPAFASWVFLPPLMIWAFLAVGLPDTTSYPDIIGIITLRTSETRPVRTPPLPRDGGVLPTDWTSSAGACRFPATSPLPH